MFYKGLLENRFFIISDSYIGGDGPHSAPCLVYKIFLSKKLFSTLLN